MENIAATSISDIPEPFRGFLGQAQTQDIGVMSLGEPCVNQRTSPQSPYEDLMFLAAILMLSDD